MKNCAQCHVTFEVSDLDREFLQKVSPMIKGKKYLISEPTCCHDCRQQRRIAWRNERNMYKRKCDFSGKDIISMYPPDAPFKVYDQSVWWSDKWNAQDYGRDFDFSRPFFEQFRELQLEVPRLALVNKQSENSQFTNHAGKNKNCYMSSVVFECEDVYYSDWIVESKDLIDCSYMLAGNELCYETYYSWAGYKAFYCDFIRQCQNIWFNYDCIGSKNCFMCWNLRNKEYCIRNKQYSKEEYEAEMSKIFPLEYSQLQDLRSEYLHIKQEKALHPGIYSIQSQNCTGDLIFTSKNSTECYDIIDMEDCRYCIDCLEMKDSMDCYHAGWAELMYECHAISNGYNCLFCHFTYDNKNILYCDGTQNCDNLFGCVGMHKASYCILNKQYSQEEYERLVPRIIEHMRNVSYPSEASDSGGNNPHATPNHSTSPNSASGSGCEWGEFFPITFAPFAYNQSRAQEFFPLTKEKVLSRGWHWSDYEPEQPQVSKVMDASQLPESLDQIPDEIVDWAITCEVSKKPFRLIKQELDFYRKLGLPVPHRHPDQRFDDRMATRNKRRLWERACDKCEKPIQTSYSPERPEKVYCDRCYLSEVY